MGVEPGSPLNLIERVSGTSQSNSICKDIEEVKNEHTPVQTLTMTISHFLSKSTTFSGRGGGGNGDTLFQSSAASGEEKYIHFVRQRPTIADIWQLLPATLIFWPEWRGVCTQGCVHFQEAGSSQCLLPWEPQFAFHRRKMLPDWDALELCT